MYTTDDGETDAAVFSAGIVFDLLFFYVIWNWMSYILLCNYEQHKKNCMDSDCGSFTQNSVEDALKSGELALSDIQRAMYNLVMVQMRLGLFDDPTTLPFSDLGKDDIATNYNLQLSLEASRQGMVLLKNNQILPLTQSDYTTVAIVGPNANNLNVLHGNYAGTPQK